MTSTITASFSSLLASIVLMMCSISAHGQAINIDSLLALSANEEQTDSLRLSILQNLAGNYYLNRNVDSAAILANYQLQLAQRGGHQKSVGSAYFNLSLAYDRMGKYSEAIAYGKQALEAFQSVGDVQAEAGALRNLSRMCQSNNEMGLAMEYGMQSLRLSERTGNEPGRASAYNSMGSLYFAQADQSPDPKNRDEYMSRALEYFEIAVDIAKAQNLTMTEMRYLQNVGMVHRYIGDLPKALEVYLRGVELSKTIDNDMFAGIVNNNIGVIYQDMAYLEADEKQRSLLFGKAREHYEEGLRLRKKIGDRPGIVNSLNNLGILASEIGDDKEALRINREALVLAEEVNDLTQIRNITYALYLSHQNLANHEDALLNYKRYITMRDTINNQNVRDELLKQEMQYAFEKQTLEENARYETNLQKQKNLRNLSLTGGAIFLLLAFVLFNRFRLKQKAAKALEAKNVEVEAARERAERSEAFRKQFLANMSHEIRTPMNAILGMTRLLKDREHDTQSLTYLNAVDHAANNLLVVINDVLDLSKLEAGKMEAALHPTHLSAELEMLNTTFSLRAAEKDLRFELAQSPDLPAYIVTDMGRVNQILYNLLGNAIKFTERGKVRLEVSCAAPQEGDGRVPLTFAVSDTGVGIAVEQQAQIFESFGQGHSHEGRRYGGTGLGLTIARSLVELLGGTLALESTPGAGSTFSFTIPCALSSAAAYEAYLRLNVFAMSERHRNYPIQILLADDNEYNRLVAVDTLRKYLPLTVIDSAESGTELLEMLPQKDYDLVLMDVQMPGMDGYACTKAIRTMDDEKLRNIHIVAFTASVIRTDIQRCYDAGMNGYIPKPFRDEDLLRPIAALIDKLDDGSPRPIAASTAPSDAIEDLALFLKLVPKRLTKLKAALAAGDVDEVKRIVHLMRPQLLESGMATHIDLIEWFEYLDPQTPDPQWKAEAEKLYGLVAGLVRERRAG